MRKRVAELNALLQKAMETENDKLRALRLAAIKRELARAADQATVAEFEAKSKKTK